MGKLTEKGKIYHFDVLFPLVDCLIEGFETTPRYNREIMIDGIPNRPFYFYKRDIVDLPSGN